MSASKAKAKGKARPRRHPATPGSVVGKMKPSIPVVCFTCARRVPIVAGHRVCEDCHASRGRCGRCGMVKR